MIAEKLALNFGPSAARVLGPRQYARTWMALLRALPEISRSKQLTPLDRLMGSQPLRVHFMSHSFVIDCPTCDLVTQSTEDSSFTFGLVRELFVRNCYLRSHTARKSSLGNVIDGGANRGLFSLYAAACGAKVVAVEPAFVFGPLIHRHMKLNGFVRYGVERAFLGERSVPVDVAEAPEILSVEDVMARHDMSQVDLLKLDIEGGEFALFSDPSWLEHVHALTMEVHRSHGHPRDLIRVLENNQFAVESRNVELRVTTDLEDCAFVYAEKRRGDAHAA